MLDSVFQLALALHGQQWRKLPSHPKVPYIAHLMGVAALVLEDGGTEEEAAAALLHDVIEDQKQAQLVKDFLSKFRFGGVVYQWVETLTEDQSLPWRDRKLAYLKAVHYSPECVRISLADKLHNAQSILHCLQMGQDPIQVFNHFHGGMDDQLWLLSESMGAYRKMCKLHKRDDNLNPPGQVLMRQYHEVCLEIGTRGIQSAIASSIPQTTGEEREILEELAKRFSGGYRKEALEVFAEIKEAKAQKESRTPEKSPFNFFPGPWDEPDEKPGSINLDPSKNNLWDEGDLCG